MFMDRSALRSEIRKRRQIFVSEHFSEIEIHQNLLALLSKSKRIGAYRSMGSEVSLDHIIDHCAAQGIKTSLPRVEGRSSAMTFRDWRPNDPLNTAGFGFVQPTAEAEPVEPDLILTPLIAFDRNMNRLGQGAGHYDRYFSQYPNALRVGISWSIQEEDALDAASWDIPLDAVMTEREWICPPTSRLAGR
jgi:5-formyltetrahydrofolate cyclo-ligase